VAQGCVHASAKLFVAVTRISEHADQCGANLINRNAMEINQMYDHKNTH